MFIEQKIKHSILEAVSTLYFLNESYSSTETKNMLKMIAAVPKEITIVLNKIEETIGGKTISFFDLSASLEQSLLTLELVGSKGIDLGVMPITEIISLRNQNLMLARLSNLVLDSLSGSEIKTQLALLASEIQEIINYEIMETLNISQNLHPLQRILWKLNSKWVDNVADDQFISEVKDILYEACYRWHERVWNNSCTVLLNSETYSRDILLCNGNVHEIPKSRAAPPPVNIVNGPEILNYSIGTKIGMHLLGSMVSVPIYSFESKITQLQKLLKVYNEPIITSYIPEALKGGLDMAFLILQQIVLGHEHYFVAEKFASLSSKISSLRVEIYSSPNIAHESIIEIKKEFEILPEKQSKYLLKLMADLSDISIWGLSVLLIGKVFVSVSMAFLRSYLPSTAIDPALSAQAQINILSAMKERIKADILVKLELAFLANSNVKSSNDGNFDSLREIEISEKKIRSRMVYRPEQSQIASIVNDLSHLGNNILRDDVLSLCLADTSDFKHNLFLQENLESFIERMEYKYPLYRDILQPVFLSLYQLRHGLVSLTAEREYYSEISPEVNRLVRNLLEFSGFLNSEELIGPDFVLALKDVTVLASRQTEINVLIAVIRRFCWGIDYQQVLSDCDLSIIHIWFNELSDKWLEAEALIVEQDKKKSELYKYKERTHEFLSEEEIEAQELLEIFPDFYDEFDSSENELGERKAAQQNQPSSLNSSGVVFQLDDIIAFQIRELHENIFSSVTLSNEKLKEIYKHVYLNSFETTSKIFEEIVNPVNFQFEVSSRAGKIFLTQTRLDSFMSVGDDFSKISEDFDFYRDYNIGEARKLQAILKSVDVMTSKLLNEWPENMLLSHLRVIHNRIASFSITTPIMKLLTGLELLFQKCHEWETVASSAVSMKSHLDEMTSLIVRWRKIELQTWKSLLKNEDRMADMKSSKLWFHLFKSLVGPALAHGNGVDDVEKVIESDLVASLDQLFLGSSLGGFHGRLALIQSFQKHLSIIRSQSKHIKAIDIMLNVLWNVYQYYFQFSDFIKTHIENQRKPIVKELDGYVRIATWKDVNVFALKESSKKSHHHLHKFVKKYRAILSMPVKDVIAAYLQDAAVEGGIVRAKSKNALSPLFSPSKEILIVENDLVSNFIGQRDIGKLVVRMQTLSYNLISGGQNLRLADGIEDLSTSIIERIRFFQTPPEADSVLKGQRSIRKKALVDLLKYLEYLGLSPNSSVKYRKHQDSTYLFSLSKLDATTTLSGAKFTGFDTNLNDATIAVLKRADVYYFKLLARMVVVREAALSFNRDLTDREMAKSLSFLENILEVIIDQRCELAKSSDLTSMSVTEGVKRCYLNLKNTTTESESFTPVNISFHVADSMIKAHKNAVDEIDAMLTQSLIVMECICKSTSLPCDSILQVVAIQNALTPSKSRASVIYERYCLRESGEVLPFIATVEIVDCLNQVRSDLESTLGNLKIAMSTYASVSWLFENICERLIIRQNELRSCMNETLDSNEDTKSKEIMNDIFLSDVSKMCEKLIDSILVAFQDLLHKDDSLISPTEFTGTMDMVQSPEFDEFGLQQGNILKSQAVFSRNFKEPRLKTISVNITKILSLINKPPPTSSAVLVQEASNTLGKLYPLLQQYLRIYQFYVYEYIGFHKATVKLAYILVNSFTVLFKKGFCIPDDDQSEVQDQKEEEDATGTGIGEGEGTKDVSNEIEDESQVEGLKSDEPAPKPEKKMKEEKDGVEMEGDFDGVLEDVSDNGEEEDEGEKEEKDGEEQMGDVDEDLADVVDEKLWDGDENAQNEEGKAEKDSKADTKPGDMDDLVAKEDDDKGEKEPPKKPDEKNDSQDTRTEVDDQIGNEDVTDEILEDLINDMENENEDNTGVKPKSSIDEDDSQQEKEDEIDLPEDLNLDTEAENAGKDEQFDMNVDKDDRPDSPVNDSISEQDGMEDQEFPLEEADAQMDRLDEKAEDEEMVEQEDVDESGGDNALPESTPKEDQDMINSEEPDNEVNDEKDEEMLQTNAKDRNVANSESQKTKDNIVNAAAENNEQENLSTEVNATASTGQDSQKRDGGKNDVANEKESTETQNENKNQKPSDFDLNPHRSLGDATKKWMNRLKSLFDRETEEEKQPDAVQNTEEEQQQEFDRENDFEFVENDLSSFDAQVLHDANNEQMDKMDQKALADGKKNEEDAMEIDQSEDEEEDENSKIPNESKSEPNEAENQGKVVNIPKSGKLHDKDENMPENEGHTDEEEGKKLEETFEESNSNEFDVESLKFHEHTNQDAEEEDIEPLDELAFEEIRKQLQESTEEWRKTGQDIAKAHLLWRKYSSLTRELSYSLCESLRLILEPSLATKLKGDYRAGKRLNMRKVIAYIASQFKKDKIWLRRTRPSKRTYQIMISIDDSRSMAESKSIELAFESLSLISKALTQLEVGEISVVSFGDDVRLLHPFDKQFSDEAGAEVIHNFTFDQNGTQVRKMMEATIDILKIARQSSQGSSELWQLQLIISDGILEDHAAVRALVRQAADAKIMVVFVVLDKRGEQDSILRMTNVSYGAGGLQMTRYMDTFPFEFYVVLNRIEDLPEVLSDTLRQYFSFVSL
ncbi:hypothetical protein HK100_003497 [Physocladia obscura]|uniref:VWFA domain-containing protein n=1 Tax=Physocladia obscura TaxID=109957 RepID=A0AAD5XL63_9FUNG|nr:hypothetical protein HK100_003497 [Physocladia obscura]